MSPGRHDGQDRRGTTPGWTYDSDQNCNASRQEVYHAGPACPDSHPIPAKFCPSSAATQGAGDFQTFLTMLTTQMQNQNPLEPTRHRILQLNSRPFPGWSSRCKQMSCCQALRGAWGCPSLGPGWAATCLSPSPIRFDGTAMRLVPPEVDGANRAELVVTDSSGQEVGRFRSIPTAPRSCSKCLPDQARRYGNNEFYQFTMSAIAATWNWRKPVLGYAPVLEARADAGRTLLVLDGGHIIDSAGCGRAARTPKVGWPPTCQRRRYAVRFSPYLLPTVPSGKGCRENRLERWRPEAPVLTRIQRSCGARMACERKHRAPSAH